MRSFATVLTLFFAACADMPIAYQRPDASPDAAAPAPPEWTPVPTTLDGALAAAGLDVAHLPALDDIDDAKLLAVMDTFTKALGMQCADCHAPDFQIETPRIRIARQMWEQLTRGLRFADGSPLYCDSCHQGARAFLDRRDSSATGELARWMRAAYVMPLVRSDGSQHGCATCHGDPFVPDFLAAWGAGPPPGDAADGGMAPPDLARAGCEALLACIDRCAATDTHCAGSCKAHAPAAAKQLLQAAEKCADDACILTGRCKNASDDTAACNQCFDNASAGGATGEACTPPSDPVCGACAGAWAACEAD